LPSPDLVIFDCDGVLVDSERLTHAVLRELLAEHGVALTLDETFEHFMGVSIERCHELIAELIGAPPPAGFLSEFDRRSFEAFETHLEPVAGVGALLEALPVPYCVASNGPHEKMRKTLGHTGLLPHFQGRLFSARDVRRPKPAPDLFLHAAATLGAAPEACIVVEDSAAGIQAAKAAGMVALGFTWRGQDEKLLRAGADAVFRHMSEAPALLARALPRNPLDRRTIPA
jgi:HAD superfamily hydrolase (TIGR01509 family)